jgi:hypothetical protein
MVKVSGWFQPKANGIAPATWQGWITSLVLVVLAVCFLVAISAL